MNRNFAITLAKIIITTFKRKGSNFIGILNIGLELKSVKRNVSYVIIIRN